MPWAPSLWHWSTRWHGFTAKGQHVQASTPGGTGTSPQKAAATCTPGVAGKREGRSASQGCSMHTRRQARQKECASIWLACSAAERESAAVPTLLCLLASVSLCRLSRAFGVAAVTLAAATHPAPCAEAQHAPSTAPTKPAAQVCLSPAAHACPYARCMRLAYKAPAHAACAVGAEAGWVC